MCGVKSTASTMDTYRQTINQIYGLQEFAIKLGLTNIKDFARRLGHPERRYPVIHLAGTNGKGSTAFFIASFLQAHGLKVGLYTSPHLKDYRERIRINDRFIAPEFIIDFWQAHKDYVYKRKATFFDTTTALGFAYFAQENVDVAVIETGLGGRLDSTNIVQPEQVVLTPVDFDHQKQLGNTLTEIASEKAGILKQGAQVFCAEQIPEARAVFLNRLPDKSRFYYLPDHLDIRLLEQSLDSMTFEIAFKNKNYDNQIFVSRQVGTFQAQNIALALLSAQQFLRQRHIKPDFSKIREVLQNKFWPGRLQTVQKEPRILFDVSHNLPGLRKTLSFVRQIYPSKAIWLLLGLLETKDFKSIVTYLSQQNLNILLTEPNTHKKLSADVLASEFARHSVPAQINYDPVAALQQARSSLSVTQVLLVTGSHYLIGDLMNHLNI